MGEGQVRTSNMECERDDKENLPADTWYFTSDPGAGTAIAKGDDTRGAGFVGSFAEQTISRVKVSPTASIGTLYRGLLLRGTSPGYRVGWRRSPRSAGI